ncbi:NADP(H)-dependent aldo-keto reductase [Vampirovibrio sp.]|uniref:NADP(H)-dependent aldo-keto reductase n=1 Tax=Vampirovibrio sp. TaxID=2717857 RepID=UPI0035942339
METRSLGNTDIKVSLIGLGTMTWGEQNTEAEAHAQMDYALAQGVNFFDTAEVYPVPIRQETSGLTETYIGTWLAARKCRDQVVLASKVAGPSERITYLRAVEPRLNRVNIEQAIEGSLKRLQTDYLDLYQLHWPDRNTNFFGQLGYTHNPSETLTPIEETLYVLSDLVKAGKIRAVGLSNETPWGVSQFLKLSETLNLPRVVSIQNPYSLLNRSFEVGLAEMAIREKVGLLAYSPMAFGLLSGKYQNGQKPSGSRLALFGEYFDRYASPQALSAAKAYIELAHKNGLTPAQMSLAFVNRQPFVSSNIIGATSLAQLKENIESAALQLSDAVLADIEAIHTQHPNPSP